jgi:hypothetical protein
MKILTQFLNIINIEFQDVKNVLGWSMVSISFWLDHLDTVNEILKAVLTVASIVWVGMKCCYYAKKKGNQD